MSEKRVGINDESNKIRDETLLLWSDFTVLLKSKKINRLIAILDSEYIENRDVGFSPKNDSPAENNIDLYHVTTGDICRTMYYNYSNYTLVK